MAEAPDRPQDAAQPFHAVAEAISLGMPYQILVSRDRSERRFVHVGENCLALNGVPAAAAIADGSVLYNLILPEDQAVFAAAEDAALDEGRAFSIEIRMRRADGEVRWHRIASVPRTLADGSTLWDGLQTDITETRNLAQELEGQRRRLQMAVDATGLGHWEWDPRETQVIWSERNRSLFGLGPEEQIDIVRYVDLVHPDDREKILQVYESTTQMEDGGDFRVEHRTITPGGEERWILTHGRVLKENGETCLVVGTSLDITERKAFEDRRSLLMGELAHRAKNGIAVMMAIVDQTARSSQTVQGFEETLMARLQAMATSQDLVTATGGRPVQLSDLIAQVMAPFGIARFDIAAELEGVSIVGPLAVGLGLLLHELATNAVKYGALSRRTGRVALVRGEAPEGRVALNWREVGGPEVKAPDRKGFGSRLLATALAAQDGKVTATYEPQGFAARIEFPIAG